MFAQAHIKLRRGIELYADQLYITVLWRRRGMVGIKTEGLDDGCKGVWWLVAVDGVGYERL